MKQRVLYLSIGLVAAALLIHLRAARQTSDDLPEDLTLTPAVVPDRELEANDALIPDGGGDRVVIDRDSRAIARVDSNGDCRWKAPLDGYICSARPPHILADTNQAYVTHADGVTALDVRTGKIAWLSHGPENHRLLLSGDLLLATDCSSRTYAAKSGRWLVARWAATGQEAFRVGLPVEDFDPLPIKEVAGLFLVQVHDLPNGAGAALLIDRAGQVRHRFDRQVVSVTALGEDRLVLTSRDVVRLGSDGGVRWVVPFADREFIPGGGLFPLPCGDVAAYLYCKIGDSGVRVMRLNPRNGKKKWEASCGPLGCSRSGEVLHSKYSQDAVVEFNNGKLVVTSCGDGTFVEAVDVETGQRVGRRVILD